MPPRYLLGPVSAVRARDFGADRAAGRCVCFDHSGDVDLRLGPVDNWEQVKAKLPSGWSPDFLLLDLSYASVPRWCWHAPLPVVALAPDWNLQWSLFQLALPRCSLVFTDRAGVGALRAAGITQAQEARLFGLAGLFATPFTEPPPPRDIDVLFVGNLNPAVQGERLPWLLRLAQLSERYKVVIASGVRGEDYRRLLRRARIVFNRSIKGEWNQRVGEAASCGALLFQEGGNPEMAGTWEHGKHCVVYGDDDLEALIEHYLEHEDERATIAARGDAIVHEYRFAAEWQAMRGVIERRWDDIQAHHGALPSLAPHDVLLLRSWQALGAQSPDDASLPGDLQATLDDPQGPAWAALALAALGGRDDARAAAGWLHRGVGRAPRSALLALGLVEALERLGEQKLAMDGAKRLLAALVGQEIAAAEDGWPLADPSFGPFRVGWEAAGWKHANDPRARDRERTALLRWRLHALLARQSGDLSHYHEAALARPDAPEVRAALGCALGRAGRVAEAAHHLRAEVTANPLDVRAARALYQALADAGRHDAAVRFAEDRRLLHMAAPGLVPEENWFSRLTVTPRAAGGLAVWWEGPLFACHSLGHVNRRLVLGLEARGHAVLPRDVPSPAPELPPGEVRDRLERLCSLAMKGGEVEVTVRHAWPPDATPPASGHWVVMQPWELGSVPKAWLGWLAQVDAVWAPTAFVRQAFLDAGLPPDRARVLPLAADHTLFRPGRPALALPTAKAVKFLSVGGTIHRKGIDVLLTAYRQAFTRDDDVCLVVKDMGGNSFYKGQTAQGLIRAFQADPRSPELLYLDRELTEEELAGLYAACDCLVAPYRGEGFGLPIAEAMSAGLPVVVTGHGAALDFVDPSVGWLVPARVVYFESDRVGDLETVGTPHLAEPDAAALASILREVAASPDERRKRGRAGRARVEAGLRACEPFDVRTGVVGPVQGAATTTLAAPIPFVARLPLKPSPARAG